VKDPSAVEDRFQRIARRLPEELLTGQDGDGLLARPGEGPGRLLGFYSADGVLAALDSYGVLETLRARGYAHFEVQLDLQPYHHGMRLLADGLVVCDCRMRRVRGASDPCIAEFQRQPSIPDPTSPHFLPDLLVVDWLSLADPRRAFTPERPRLPGQTHPGSGVGLEVFLILTLCARRLHLHGLLETPERLHNAVLYQERSHFLDPTWEGTFLALRDLLNHLSLAELAWAMEEGRVIDDTTGEVIRWRAREQLLPLDDRLAAYFELPAWRRARSAARQSCRPRVV